MPPSRELDFQIDPDVQARLERHLRLKAPVRVKVRRDPSGKNRGLYEPASRLIVLQLGFSDYQGSRLTLIRNQILLTLLHEFRHAHQFDHWPPRKLTRDLQRNYHSQEVEEDANEWASRSLALWGSLGRVRVKSGGSPLRRLSKAERSLR